jgi:hypothetical protein
VLGLLSSSGSGNLGLLGADISTTNTLKKRGKKIKIKFQK